MPSSDSSQTAPDTPVSAPSTPSLPTTFAGAVASAAKKAGEVLNKLVGSGQTQGFTSLIKGVDLTPHSGQTLVSNATTGEQIGVVGTPTVENRQAISDSEDRTMGLKVKIWQVQGFEYERGLLVLDAMPTIMESRSVSYDTLTPLHAPGEILKYKNTSNRSWDVTARLISRTVEEATNNLDNLNMIRTWTMPFYGTGTATSMSEMLGAPPPILMFEAYGENMIGPLPCVMESYSTDFPNDIDYINAVVQRNGKIVKVPFPVILSITIRLKEAWAPKEMSNFDITKYRSGNMSTSYKPVEKQESVSYTSSVGFDASSDAKGIIPASASSSSSASGYDASLDAKSVRSMATSITKQDILGNSQMRGIPNELTTAIIRGGPMLKKK